MIDNTMKSSFYKKLIVIVTLLLSGCVATTDPTVPRLDVNALQQQLLALPGAAVDLETLALSYPGEVLFASGSVLPLPGGMELLGPLMRWMLQDEAIYGEALVRSSGHTTDYDRTLAEKRLELLVLLFENSGVTADKLKLIVDDSVGAPLEIRFQLRSPATSSGENS
jgi:hypothetical protein